MTDLSAGLDITSAVAGVENFVAKILCIFIAAGEDHGVGPFSSTARNPRDPRPVYTGLREFEARGETTTFRVSWHVAEDSLFHEVASEVAE
jgi:hypothetical protein